MVSPRASEASPVARLLLGLAERNASAQVLLGARRVLVRDGELAGVSPADNDETFPEFLCNSGRVTRDQVDAAREQAESEGLGVDEILVRQAHLTELDAGSARRAMWLDRLVRALGSSSLQMRPPESLAPAPTTGTAPRYDLVTLLLDALARVAVQSDAARVASRLNHRLAWRQGPHKARASAWAAFGDLPARPVLSLVLARNPAGAPLISALLRADLVALQPPGLAPPARAPVPETLPPPVPRTETLPPAAWPTLAGSSLPSDGPTRASTPAPASTPPGTDAGARAQALTPTRKGQGLPRTPLPEFRRIRETTDDPLLAVEERIAELEGSSSDATLLARSWCEAGRLWLDHYGSVEEAARCYREAAAADPANQDALREAAKLCFALGQAQVADAYARGAAEVAGSQRERARVMRLRAAIARARGDSNAMIEALCEAAALDELDPEPHMMVAYELAADGNLDGAVAHAKLAASGWRGEQTARACAVIAWAYTLRPEDASLASQYAELLEDESHPTAAVAVLARTASLSSETAVRRNLLLSGAQRATAIRRPDLAAELLLEAFTSEPHVELTYGALLTALESQGDHSADCAVVAEEIAAHCPPEQRGVWLTHAAECALRADRGRDTALVLLYRAVAADPLEDGALQGLRARASSALGRSLLADALALAAEAQSGSHHARACELFKELATFVERHLHAAGRALGAWQRVLELDPGDEAAEARIERLRTKARAQESMALAARRELAAARGRHRAYAARKLAALLRDKPESRGEAADLYAAYLEEHPDDEAASATLEGLLELIGHNDMLAAFLQKRLTRSTDAAETARLLSHLAAVHTRRRDARAVAHACVALLAFAPRRDDGVARLERAAVRLREPELLREALVLRAQLTRNPRERSRALARLASLLETNNEPQAAVAAADAALVADESCADAALLILRHSRWVPLDRSVRVCSLARLALGDSAAVLRALANAAERIHADDVLTDALQAWFALAPLDPEVPARRLSHALRTGHGTQIAAAATIALHRDRISASTFVPLVQAIDKLSAMGDARTAAGIALLALGATGRADQELAQLALDKARRCGNHALLRDALEYQAALSREPQRTIALVQLAEVHRKAGQPAAETRALLRAVARPPREPDALSRLAALYAQSGDGERLLAVLSLQLEAGSEAQQRHQGLLDLASAAAHVAGDRQRALGYVAMLAHELAHDQERLAGAVGTLRSLGDDRWALAAALEIAAGLAPQPAAQVCAWVAATAEHELGDVRLALEAATRGLDRDPSEPTLLEVFERLALSLGAFKEAQTQFARLEGAARGNHGRRAALYRAARWHERAGEPATALRYYAQAFELAPSRGVSWVALARLARETGDFEALVQACLTLANTTREGPRRSALLQRAADLSEMELGDLKRAFPLRLRIWQSMPVPLFGHAARLAALRLAKTDPTAGHRALHQWANEQKRHLVDAPDDELKYAQLLELAELECFDLGLTDSARKTLRQARTLPAGSDLPSRTTNALDALDACCGDDSPNRRPAGERRAQLRLGTRSSRRIAMNAGSSAPILMQASGALHEIERSARQSDTMDTSSQGPVAPLQAALRNEPWQPEKLRALRDILEQAPNHGHAQALGDLVRTFRSDAPSSASPAPRKELATQREAAWIPQAMQCHPLHRLLALVELAVLELRGFVQSLDALGLDSSEQVQSGTPSDVPGIYNEVAGRLGLTGMPLFLVDGPPVKPHVVPASPAAIVASRHLAGDQAMLRFRFARALEQGRPGHALLAGLEQPRARELFAAVRGAFAAGSEEVTDSELAKRLRRGAPLAQQQEISTLMAAIPGFGFELAIAAVEAAAMRSGLLLCGDVASAVAALRKDEGDLSGSDLTTEDGFERACRQSPALQELVRSVVDLACEQNGLPRSIQ
ncbi:MAG: hypothetical protein MJD61_14995 [Proteobacteria bacterium]|nr:hypothetical protein [Pseudomonadota bacterium]